MTEQNLQNENSLLYGMSNWEQEKMNDQDYLILGHTTGVMLYTSELRLKETF